MTCSSYLLTSEIWENLIFSYDFYASDFFIIYSSYFTNTSWSSILSLLFSSFNLLYLYFSSCSFASFSSFLIFSSFNNFWYSAYQFISLTILDFSCTIACWTRSGMITLSKYSYLSTLFFSRNLLKSAYWFFRADTTSN